MTITPSPSLARRFIQVFPAPPTAKLLALLLPLSGCASGSANPSGPGPSTEAGNLFSGPAAATARGEAASNQWTIAIVASKNQAMAAAALEKVQTTAGFRQAYLIQRGDALVVSYGSYASATDSQAQTDLKRLRSFEYQGGRPFADAILAPPETLSVQGSIPELDLRSVHKDPMSKAKYTLQVGVYGRLDTQGTSASDLAEFRRAAEQAAAKLRREGEEAYYFHGPSRSMVLIGAFDETEYDESHPGAGDGPRLKEARQKFPYNLVNGAGYKQTRPGATEGSLQRSQVVMIPK